MTAPELRTRRLRLRHWRAEDPEPFAALNADPVAMEHFPAPLSTSESDALADRIERDLTDNDFGLWAVEVPGVAPPRPSCTLRSSPRSRAPGAIGSRRTGRATATRSSCSPSR